MSASPADFWRLATTPPAAEIAQGLLAVGVLWGAIIAALFFILGAIAKAFRRRA